MRDRREHVLVLAEIHAAENGFRGEIDSGVAHELDVDVESYRAYRKICAAIDDYELRYRGHEVLNGISDPPSNELETAERLIGYSLDLHRTWRGSTGWNPDEVCEYARRILATTLTLKAQLERRQLKLGHEHEAEVGLAHEL